MKKAAIFFFSCLLLISCSKDVADKKEGRKMPESNAQTVKRNKSIIKAEIINISKENNLPVAVKAKALEVKGDVNFENIAVANEVYDLKINYSMDPLGNKLKNEKNKNLEQLKEVKQGDVIWIEINYDASAGWLINKVVQGS